MVYIKMSELQCLFRGLFYELFKSKLVCVSVAMCGEWGVEDDVDRVLDLCLKIFLDDGNTMRATPIVNIIRTDLSALVYGM